MRIASYRYFHPLDNHLVRKMSLQEMQQFQEKHKAARADDIVGTDQQHTSSVGMHQGNARDLPDNTQRWRSKLPGGIHQQEFV